MKNTTDSFSMDRRLFLQIPLVTVLAARSGAAAFSEEIADLLRPTTLLKGLRKEDGNGPLPDAVRYTAGAVGDGVEYQFEKGFLAGKKYLTMDFLVDGKFLVVFHLYLQEGENGPTFRLQFKGLNQCSARLRLPLEAANLNRWMLEREGAWLKPICGGQRVDLGRVDRMRLVVTSKSEEPSVWFMTPFRATADEPERLQDPVLPKGPLLDEFGQSTVLDWPEKTRSEEELIQRLRAQRDQAPSQKWPEGFSHWGGWAESQVEGTGFFRTHHDETRWWLVDPDGHLFWSTGLDCVSPHIDANCRGITKALTWLPEKESKFGPAVTERAVDFLIANLIRAFGPDEWKDHWAEITLGQMQSLGFNTVANWSEWAVAKAARRPYVRPLGFRNRAGSYVYRDFPDVFHPDFEKQASNFAAQLDETKDDPALIGYFLMNEPTWGFSEETPAAGMLFNAPNCECRKALADFLRKQYADDAALSRAWGMETSLSAVAAGPWSARLSEAAEKDLAAFSAVMVEKFFGTLSAACKKVDPHHLNLGVRYHTVPPSWALSGMKSFDVFSMNCYRDKVPAGEVEKVGKALNLPVMIGEYHFGALDAGLPSPGLRHVRSQEARGRAYRVYTEDAAANPWVVGAHYFILYDQSALGRFDGENYNIGFLDVCNRPYEPLCQAARACHERIYAVASGREKPFDQAPESLPNLF